MKLTDEERKYLSLLSKGLSFEEMAVELGMTAQEVEEFGTKFFDRAFEEREHATLTERSS